MSQNTEEDDIEHFDIEDLKILQKTLIQTYYDDTEELEEYDDSLTGEILAKITIGRMRLEITKEIRNIEQRTISDSDEESIDENLKMNMKINKIQSTSHQIINYFVLTSTLIESLSIDLLKKELIADEHSNAKKTDNIIEHRLDQELREDLLYRTGIIDESLKSELSHVRHKRNSLVHDVNNYLLLETIENIPSELKRVHDTYSRLFEKVSEDDTIELPIGAGE